ncbi:MAG: hypothetical protein KF886_24360 [Candidatus Hydrogenedentes bacterium]|nr:hypothetical protein [Candidatus Hydrogenedentota bacterium]
MFASAWDIQSADDGGFVIAGRAYEEGVANARAYIMKVDGTGVLQWATGFGEDGNYDGLAVQPAGDGGYLLAGMVNGLLGFGKEPIGDPGILIAKADAAGNAVWSRAIEISGFDVAYGLCVNPDGSFLVAGLTEGRGLNFADAFLMKFDAGGSEIWRRQFTQDDGLSSALDVIATHDGGYAFVGEAIGSLSLYVVKTDASGNEAWSYKGFDSGPLLGSGEGIVQTRDGGYAVAGRRIDACFVAKLDADGNLLWAADVPGAPYAEGFDIVELADGSLVVAGRSHSRGAFAGARACIRYFAARLSEEGEVRWTGRLGRNIDSGTAYAVAVGADGNVALVGDNAARGFYLITTDAGQFTGNGGEGAGE